MSKQTKKRTVNLGTFDSERYWRDEELSQLPAMKDEQQDNILMTMDELLFTSCKKGDILITRYQMDAAHKKYLSEIGFEFIHNDRDLVDDFEDNNKRTKPISQLLLESKDQTYFKEMFHEKVQLSPFSVLQHTRDVADLYKLQFQTPSVDVIKKVNSKIYSTRLKDKLGIKDASQIVTSSDDLKEKGLEYLKTGAFLIKDDFGVSGKGNLLIESETIFNRIIRYIVKQERKGKQTKFVVEPYMDKALDFSCQFFINQQGDHQLLSMQKLVNTGFAYQGSYTADEEFMDELAKEGYFVLLEKLAKELYDDGYFGHVCVDSMILKDGQIVPIIEVNARKSMSLIKHYLDVYLNALSLQGNFTYISVAYADHLLFEEIIEKMDSERLLFRPLYGKGIIPLSSNTLLINSKLNQKDNMQKVYKGRFYVSVVGNSHQEQESLIKRFTEFLKVNGFKVYN